MTYATEWDLFSLYFKQVYDWSSSWTGIAQMAGDLLAGICLVLSTMKRGEQKKKRRRATHGEQQGAARLCCRWSMALPFNVVVLIMIQALCSFMLAQPVFSVAVTGQVAMGTAFVLLSQIVQEMCTLYSMGDKRIYRQLVFLTRFSLNLSCAAVAPPALWAYEHYSKTASFLFVAAVDAAFGIAFALYYFKRMTPLGVRWAREFPTLAAAEEELLRRHTKRLRRGAEGRDDDAVQVVGPAAGSDDFDGGGGGEEHEAALVCL